MKGIGIFDSGVGGLTVLKELKKTLPTEKFYYLGDTARVPYGTKSQVTVIKYALQNAKFLLSLGIKFLVVACNTASSYALNVLEEELPIPVIGVVKPGVQEALSVTRGRIGVIGTSATIASKSYFNEIKKHAPEIEVFQKACPLFVPLAEEGLFYHPITLQVAEMYLEELKEKNIDTLILGCTHYPMLKKAISEIMGKNVVLVDSAQAIAKHIKKYLVLNNNVGNFSGEIKFFVTDSPENFKEVGEKFLGEKIEEISQIDIGNRHEE